MFAVPTVVLPTILFLAVQEPSQPPIEDETTIPTSRAPAHDIPEDVPTPPGPAPTTAEPTAEEQAQALYESGKQSFLVGDFDRAIKAFEEAYNLSQVTDLLYNISLAYLRRYEVSHLRTDLDRARVVATNLRDELAADPDADLSGADQLLEEIVRKQEEAGAPTPEPTPQVVAETEGPLPTETKCLDPVIDTSGDRRRRVGGAVTMGLGGAVLAGGAVSVAYFALKGREFKSTFADLQAQYNADSCGSTSSARCDALQDSMDITTANGRQANILAGTLGAGLMTIGAAGIITGAVLLDKGKSDPTQARLQIRPGWRGAVLTGRF